MANYSVQLQFEADTNEAAQAILDSWTLSDGVTVLSVISSDFAPGTPVVVGGGVQLGAEVFAEPEAPPTK